MLFFHILRQLHTQYILIHYPHKLITKFYNYCFIFIITSLKDLAQDRDQLRALVKTVMNLRFP
jgi:hypothetical protein